MIFVDSSALYAVLDRDDDNHAAAQEVWSRLLQTDEPLLVTNYIIVETAALIQHRLGMDAVRVLCGEVLPALDVHWITGDDHGHAQNALLAADRRRLSLVDCSSVHIMRSVSFAPPLRLTRTFVSRDSTSCRRTSVKKGRATQCVAGELPAREASW